MTRYAKKNAVIALLVLLLAVLLVWIAALNRQDRQTMLERILIAEQDATHIVIRRDGTELEFSREAAVWRMVKPLDTPANEQRILPLLSLLTLPGSHRYALADIDASKLGLDPPQASVIINQLSFAFGSADASGRKRYLQTGNGVYLVDDLVFPLISSPPETFTATVAAD